MSDSIKKIEEYYSQKLSSFGATPAGVDWNGEAGQLLRFAQLSKLFDAPAAASVADIGCNLAVDIAD